MTVRQLRERLAGWPDEAEVLLEHGPWDTSGVIRVEEWQHAEGASCLLVREGVEDGASRQAIERDLLDAACTLHRVRQILIDRVSVFECALTTEVEAVRDANARLSTLVEQYEAHRATYPAGAAS